MRPRSPPPNDFTSSRPRRAAAPSLLRSSSKCVLSSANEPSHLDRRTVGGRADEPCSNVSRRASARSGRKSAGAAGQAHQTAEAPEIFPGRLSGNRKEERQTSVG